MSETPPVTPDTEIDRSNIDRERILAAEYSLGLLEGEELLAARRREVGEPEFAARLDWWNDWFVPLTDDVAGMEPDADVWKAIAAQVKERAAGASADATIVVLDMERRVRRWQWTTALTSAAAAIALAVFVFSPGTNAPVPQNTPAIAAADAPLMASILIGDTSLRLGVTFLPASDEMLVSAAGLSADGVHDHELWLVPADGGTPQSLGVVIPGEQRRVALSEEIAKNMGDGVKLVLTREPLGGKPEGVAAGPVVAQGAFGEV